MGIFWLYAQEGCETVRVSAVLVVVLVRGVSAGLLIWANTFVLPLLNVIYLTFTSRAHVLWTLHFPFEASSPSSSVFTHPPTCTHKQSHTYTGDTELWCLLWDRRNVLMSRQPKSRLSQWFSRTREAGGQRVSMILYVCVPVDLHGYKCVCAFRSVYICPESVSLH